MDVRRRPQRPPQPPASPTAPPPTRHQQLANAIREATQTPTRAELDLWIALDLSDPLDREIITLTFWEGFNFVEVATLLQRPAPTIRTRYRRNRIQLRSALQLDDDEHGPATAPLKSTV